jgi:hypothetical protein
MKIETKKKLQTKTFEIPLKQIMIKEYHKTT